MQTWLNLMMIDHHIKQRSSGHEPKDSGILQLWAMCVLLVPASPPFVYHHDLDPHYHLLPHTLVP